MVSGARFNPELSLLGPFATGEVVAATVNGVAVSYTVQAGDIKAQSTDTLASVATGLAAAINAQAAVSAALIASASGARIAFAPKVSGAAYTAVPTGDKLNAVDVPVLTGTESTLTLSTTGEMTLAGSLTAAGKMTLQASEVKDEFADYFNNLNGLQLTQTASQADAATIVAGLNANQSFSANSKLAALFTGGALTIDASNAVLVSLANYVPFAELPEATRNAIATAQGYQTMATGGYFNPTSGRFFTTIQDGPVVGYNIDAINWGSTAKPTKGTAFASLSTAQQQVIASALGYSVHSGTVFYNRLAQGQEVVTGFAQGESADYDNSRINWAAAGLSPPAANTSFAQLSAAQKLVVANSLGYLFDYDRIAYESWSSVPFDYSTVTRAEWTEASSLNFALVISDKQWGTVAKPSTGTPYSGLTSAQKAVVDQHVKFVPTQTDLFTLSGTFTAGQTLSLVLNGSTLSYTVQGSDIGANAAATLDNVAQAVANLVNAQQSAVTFSATSQAVAAGSGVTLSPLSPATTVTLDTGSETRFTVSGSATSPILGLRGNFAAGDVLSLSVNGKQVKYTVAAADLGTSTEATHAKLAVALASDASAHVNGQVFAVRNNEIFLMSQPRPIRSVHRSEGWTPQSVLDQAMPALQSSFFDLERSGDVFSWDPI